MWWLSGTFVFVVVFVILFGQCGTYLPGISRARRHRPELAAALGALGLELLARPTFGRALLNEVAVAVTAGEWPQAAHPDRFAFAVDIGGGYGEANALKTLGKARYRQLEKARWL